MVALGGLTISSIENDICCILKSNKNVFYITIFLVKIFT